MYFLRTDKSVKLWLTVLLLLLQLLLLWYNGVHFFWVSSQQLRDQEDDNTGYARPRVADVQRRPTEAASGRGNDVPVLRADDDVSVCLHNSAGAERLREPDTGFSVQHCRRVATEDSYCAEQRSARTGSPHGYRQ